MAQGLNFGDHNEKLRKAAAPFFEKQGCNARNDGERMELMRRDGGTSRPGASLVFAISRDLVPASRVAAAVAATLLPRC